MNSSGRCSLRRFVVSRGLLYRGFVVSRVHCSQICNNGARYGEVSCHPWLRHAEATKRGLGAAMMQKPTRLARFVAGVAEGSALPMTVTIRLGENNSHMHVHKIFLRCSIRRIKVSRKQSFRSWHSQKSSLSQILREQCFFFS